MGCRADVIFRQFCHCLFCVNWISLFLSITNLSVFCLLLQTKHFQVKPMKSCVNQVDIQISKTTCITEVPDQSLM